jgi:CelD/BcsL family acetyltransferase involved in cellulose biosynthesis
LDAISNPSSRYVLVFDVTGRLLGGMPFQVRHTVRGLAAEMAGVAHGAVSMDAIVAPGATDQVTRGVMDWLGSGEVKRVNLEGLSETSILRNALPSQLAWFSYDVSPWGFLPASSDEYWSQRPSWLRRNVRDATRRLERAGVVYDCPGPDDAPVVAAEYARLFKIRWGYKNLVPEPAQFVLALERGLTTGELVVHRLRIDGTAIAVDIWFHVGGVASYWRTARDADKRWDGAGHLLQGHGIEHAIARGDHAIDLLRDGNPYKYDWVDQQRQVGQIQDVLHPTLRDIAPSVPSLLNRYVRREAARVKARFR